MGGAGREGRCAGLIPDGHAGVVVFALVPTCRPILWVLVGRQPTEVFDADLDAGVENDRILNVPAVGRRVPAHDAPLIEIGHAEIGGADPFQAPRTEEIIFRARAPDRSLALAVNIDFLVALAEPGRAARADGQHGTHVMPLALGVEEKVILALLDRVFLPVLRVEVGCVIGKAFLLDPVDVVVEQADRFFALVDDFHAGRLAEGHPPVTVVRGAVGHDDR